MALPGETWSYNGGRGVLEGKVPLEEIEAVGRAYHKIGWGYSKEQVRAREIMMADNWRQNVSYSFERDGCEYEVTVDAVKDGIHVEHDRGVGTATNWNFLKLEAAAQLLDASVDLIVQIGPDLGNPGFDVLDRSLVTITDPLVQFDTPIFIWEYDQVEAGQTPERFGD